MRVAALQFCPSWEDRQASYALVRTYAARAKDQGAKLLVLPEMFATGFSMNPAVTAEPEDGPTPRFLAGLAASLQLAVVGGYVAKAAAGKGQNLAVVYDAHGQRVAAYVKLHLFSYMQEDAHHESGAGPVTFALDGLRGALAICYDLRFPELFRATAESTDVAIVIASWPAARQGHWDLLLPARAVENQQYVVGVNRVGQGGGQDYTGGSAIYDPLGQRLAFGGDAEGLLFADIAPAAVADVRKTFPFLKDRKPTL